VRALYLEYGRPVYAVAWRVLGRTDLAQAATRETFVRAWQASAHVDPDGDPAMWLATIAETVAREFARREPDVPNAPEPGELSQVWDTRQAIDRLTQDEATVVRLQHLDGLNMSEIAHRLELPLATVQSRSQRAHQELATLLATRSMPH
jgi:RNA polymerase sigma-70 factor (ECF subfamily)